MMTSPDAFCVEQVPSQLEFIRRRTQELGFDMACDLKTGAFLRLLAASKPGSRFLEIGTGTGMGLSWMLQGMDSESRITSVDENVVVQDVAREAFPNDPRLTLVTQDGHAFLLEQKPSTYDFIFADAIPGKYALMDHTLGLLRPGGLYIVDDMVPQPDWPEDHHPEVRKVLANLQADRPGFHKFGCAWSTGLIVFTKKA